MFVHRISMKSVAAGTTFLIGEAEVTLQACAKTGRLLVLVEAPPECRINMNPDELGPTGPAMG